MGLGLAFASKRRQQAPPGPSRVSMSSCARSVRNIPSRPLNRQSIPKSEGMDARVHSAPRRRVRLASQVVELRPSTCTRREGLRYTRRRGAWQPPVSQERQGQASSNFLRWWLRAATVPSTAPPRTGNRGLRDHSFRRDSLHRRATHPWGMHGSKPRYRLARGEHHHLSGGGPSTREVTRPPARRSPRRRDRKGSYFSRSRVLRFFLIMELAAFEGWVWSCGAAEKHGFQKKKLVPVAS